MVQGKHSFKANIRLKDIIGQGLINNSNIAIIELIKNARDAKSKNVTVVFEGADSPSAKSRIIIQDTGIGMDLDSIINKWLNIAYSEKRNADGGIFAGDKGIGRFSCDRLGRKLNLYTKKATKELVHLEVNWADFEVDDIDKEISSVKLNPEYISKDEFKEKTGLPVFNKGTCLVIEDLRETWGRNELEKLKKELERFIIDPEKQFEVYFKSLDFKDKDGNFQFDETIENKLLHKLDEKTISIHSSIVEDGKIIKTELRHYGSTILSFEEDNPYTELKNVVAHIHYLSQASKVSFKNITGYTSAEYGSVMFFYNGFRVMPYGDPKDDWLGLNQRKTQGTNRFIGTRELFGIVEAYDNERRLNPVSSREGMENNRAFKQLTDAGFSETKSAYLPGVLSILEKYVVNGIDWDRVRPGSGSFSERETQNAMLTVLESYKKNKRLKKIHINYKIIKKIAEEKIASYDNFMSELLINVSDKAVYDLTPSEKKDVKKYIDRHENTMAVKAATNIEYQKTVEVEKKRRLFAESHLTSDTQRVKNLQHVIGIINGEICTELEDILKGESSGKVHSREQIIAAVQRSFFKSRKIRTLSQIITKANFDMMSESIRHNIYSYIQQYTTDMRKNGAIWGLDIKFDNPTDVDMLLNFSPIEVSMLIDNALSNAQKANARTIKIKAQDAKDQFSVEFIDDGDGLSTKFKPEDYFKEGITTTSRGAGIGLSHIQQIMSDLEGEVSLQSNGKTGATLKIWWPK